MLEPILASDKTRSRQNLSAKLIRKSGPDNQPHKKGWNSRPCLVGEPRLDCPWPRWRRIGSTMCSSRSRLGEGFWRRFGRTAGLRSAAPKENAKMAKTGGWSGPWRGNAFTWGRPPALRARLASVGAANVWTTKRPTGLSARAPPFHRRVDRLAGPRCEPNTALEGWREKGPSIVCLPCSCIPGAINREAPMFEFRPIRQNTDGSNVAKLAIKGGVAICLCIVASEWLASAAQKGGLPRVQLVWPESEPWREVKTAPSLQATSSVTVYRNIGLDGVTTSTIPRTYRRPPVISPCGDES